MCEHGDELISQFRCLVLLGKLALDLENVSPSVQVPRDQIREERSHADDAIILDLGRIGIDAAECAKEAPVGEYDGDRDVGLESILERRVVLCPGRICRHFIDCDKFASLTDLVADRRFDLEFATRRQTEADPVVYGACDPSVRGHSCDGAEAHARRLMQHR